MTTSARVLIHNSETAGFADALRSTFPKVPFAECQSYDDLPQAMQSFAPNIVYSVRFSGTAGFPRAALVENPNLKWLAVGGAGIDHLGMWDTGALQVTNTAGVAAEMMAEYILGGFLHFTLDVPGLQSDQQARHWNAARTVRPLHGRTLLIVGLGQTGRAVAKRAQAFGMRVIGTRARPQPMDHVDVVHPSGQLLDVLPEADFVAVTVPLTVQTRGMIGAKALEVIKPGAVIADVSRGGVIDHVALRAALASGRVAGAVLDVFEEEPLPADNPMWQAPNTLISPHCSSVYDGWEDASFVIFLDNLQRWLDGAPLKNIVDPVRGY